MTMKFFVGSAMIATLAATSALAAPAPAAAPAAPLGRQIAQGPAIPGLCVLVDQPGDLHLDGRPLRQ